MLKVGEVVAERIIQECERREFRRLEDLTNVSDISAKILQLNLNNPGIQLMV